MLRARTASVNKKVIIHLSVVYHQATDRVEVTWRRAGRDQSHSGVLWSQTLTELLMAADSRLPTVNSESELFLTLLKSVT